MSHFQPVVSTNKLKGYIQNSSGIKYIDLRTAERNFNKEQAGTNNMGRRLKDKNTAWHDDLPNIDGCTLTTG